MTHERLAGLALVLLIATTSAAAACSCARNPTAEGILSSATAVFTGIAEDSRTIGPNRSITTFRVVESFKGAKAGTIKVQHNSGSSASCGVTFEVGKTYTLAAHRTQNGLSTGLCATWMFLPHVGLSEVLIRDMRALGGR